MERNRLTMGRFSNRSIILALLLLGSPLRAQVATWSHGHFWDVQLSSNDTGRFNYLQLSQSYNFNGPHFWSLDSTNGTNGWVLSTDGASPVAHLKWIPVSTGIDSAHYILNLAYPFTYQQSANFNILGNGKIKGQLLIDNTGQLYLNGTATFHADAYAPTATSGRYGLLGFQHSGDGVGIGSSNGALLIGDGSGTDDWHVSTLTPGAGISITNSTGSITINSNGSDSGHYILNRLTPEQFAGFNIAAGAPSVSSAYTEASILNDATSSTPAIAKIGLSVSSVGAWNSPNKALVLNSADGSFNYDVYGTAGTWSVNDTGFILTKGGVDHYGANAPLEVNGDQGTTGQVLTSQGAGNTPAWTTPSAGSNTATKTAAQLTANTNNWGLLAPDTNIYYTSADTIWDVTGIIGGTEGRLIRLLNTGSHPYILRSNNTSSTDTARFQFYADEPKALGPNGAMAFVYTVVAAGSSFSRIDTFTYDHTLNGGSDGTNEPILVSFTDANYKTVANGGVVTNANGYDINFYSDAAGTTLLNWEIEKYVATTGQVIAWVKIPTVSHTTDGKIYAFYGNSSITTFQGGAAGSVWDANYFGVYHYPDGTTLNVNDFTSNSHNGTNHSAGATTGQIDGSMTSATGYVDLGANATSGLTHITVEAWIKPSTTSSRQDYLGNWSYPNQKYLLLSGLTSSKFEFFASTNGTSAITSGTGSFSFSSGTWYHIVGVFDGSNVICYINGTANASNSLSGNLYSGTLNDYIGQSSDANSSAPIDEVRISSVARSADYVLQQYNSQSNSSYWTHSGAAISAIYTKRWKPLSKEQ